ncbi:MAG: hypothetical protein AB7N76_06205 [Planctomycetota bacterium]
MSDQRRRALEREAHGDREQAAALLLERVRAGELSPTQLELLALLGEPAAALALPDARVLPAAPDPQAFAAALLPFGKPVLVRAALAAARPLLRLLEEHAPWERRPQEALDAVAAWLTAPQREPLRVAVRLTLPEVERAGEELSDNAQPTVEEVELAFVAHATGAVAELAAELREVAWVALTADALAQAEALHEDLGAEDGAVALARAALRRWCLGE